MVYQSDLGLVRSVSAALFPLREPTSRGTVTTTEHFTEHYISWDKMLGLRRHTYIVIVATALSEEGRLIVELILEIVLTQVPQGCAHLSMLQLFLGR